MAAPQAHKKRFDLASGLLARGELREAVKVLEKLYSSGADPERCLSGLAQIHLQLGENRQAIKRLKVLCKLDPGSALYCDTLVGLYEEAGQLSQAIACYKNLVQHNSEPADSYYNLAQLQTKAGFFADAMESYQLALRSNISAPEDVYVNLSLIHAQFAQQEQARECLAKALQQNPLSIPALFNLASRDEEIGDMGAAERGFEKVLEIDHSHSLALARLSGVKKYQSAESELAKKLSAAAENEKLNAQDQIDLNYALGKVHDDLQQYDKAFAAYQKANELQKHLAPPYIEIEQEDFVSNIIKQFDQRWFTECKPISNARLLFICGMFRSGSTLAEQIVSAHTKVSAGGECDYFPRLVNGELAPFPYKSKNISASKLKLYAEGYLDYLSARCPPGQLVTDKRPDNFLYIGLIKTLFPNAQFIYTCRKPIDNCLSVYFTQLSSNQAYATDLHSVVHYYQQQQRLMKHWQSLFAGSLLELNYETLLADPGFQIQRVLEFCELDWEESCLNFHANSNAVSTASAWQVRQPLYTTSIDRWHNYKDQVAPLLEKFAAQPS